MMRTASKRALDLALLLPLTPLFGALIATLAFIVLCVDGRPVFFLQKRVGKGGKPFTVFKLRTMTNDADESARRPTRLGALLRKHGVDELPQLGNVLVGSMSLVGPRPLTQKDVDRLVAQHPPFAARFEVKPGLTGFAQVHKTNGIADSARLDAEYARRQGAVVDIAVLTRTVWINLVGKQRGKLAL
jgi:lipopolysaccharide/colanic/teichoic acid biosynthesis glycosyltransferase